MQKENGLLTKEKPDFIAQDTVKLVLEVNSNSYQSQIILSMVLKKVTRNYYFTKSYLLEKQSELHTSK